MSSGFNYSEWPPALTSPQLEDLSMHSTTYALAHGLLYLPPIKLQPSVPTAAVHAPFALLPSPFPRKLFLEAKKVQRIYNVLYARIAMDEAFLDDVMGAEHGLGKVDDFIGQLWKGWKQLRNEGLAQALHLGIFRSDYLLHSPSGEEHFLKQVEFNTIAASFGALSQRVSELHRYLCGLTSYHNISPYLKADNFPENNALSVIAEGMVTAHSAYGVPGAWILFVIRPDERNIFDQRWIEYYLFERHHIRVVRQTFDQLMDNARLEPNARQLYISGDPGIAPSGSVEIAVIYYRSGYAPSEYTTPNHYSLRFLLEQSRAIKCPTIALQLAGGKKIQQMLTQPGVLESFLCDPKRGTVFAPAEVEAVRNTFMAMWGLDASEDGGDSDHEATRIQREEHGVRRARENAHSLVLKPQREGGGNNIYKEDIPAFLDRLDPRERQAWVAMELITPPRGTGNYLLRAGTNSDHDAVKAEVISELGIYGWALFGNSETMVEKEGGWLLRTKEKESNEGGVATGFSVLDSLLLIDD